MCRDTINSCESDEDCKVLLQLIYCAEANVETFSIWFSDFACFANIRGQDSVMHYTITATDCGYLFGLAKFANVTEFLEHFKSQPLLGGESGSFHTVFFEYFSFLCLHWARVALGGVMLSGCPFILPFIRS